MGANVKFGTLMDITRKGYNLHVECTCGHKAIVDAAKMERWYLCHGWSTTAARLRDHLYCMRCRSCPAQVHVGITAGTPTAPDRFPKSEEQWARLVRGLRNW